MDIYMTLDMVLPVKSAKKVYASTGKLLIWNGRWFQMTGTLFPQWSDGKPCKCRIQMLTRPGFDPWQRGVMKDGSITRILPTGWVSLSRIFEGAYCPMA